MKPSFLRLVLAVLAVPALVRAATPHPYPHPTEICPIDEDCAVGEVEEDFIAPRGKQNKHSRYMSSEARRKWLERAVKVYPSASAKHQLLGDRYDDLANANMILCEKALDRGEDGSPYHIIAAKYDRLCKEKRSMAGYFQDNAEPMRKRLERTQRKAENRRNGGSGRAPSGEPQPVE